MEEPMTEAQHAVITSGGKQYIVGVGDTIAVEKLADQPGTSLTFTDELSGSTVTAKVVQHYQGEKVRGRIFRNKTRSSRFPHGHRQWRTNITIETIA